MLTSSAGAVLLKSNATLPDTPAQLATIWWSIIANTVLVSEEGPKPNNSIDFAFLRVAAFLDSLPPEGPNVSIWFGEGGLFWPGPR